MDAGRWIAVSEIPDGDFLDRIRTALRECRPAGKRRVASPTGKHCALRASLEEVLDQLADHLRADHREHLAERDDAPYQVDYVVTTEGLGDSALGVWTRLSSPRKPGQIFYGPTVVREGEDEFSLWLDPE